MMAQSTTHLRAPRASGPPPAVSTQHGDDLRLLRRRIRIIAAGGQALAASFALVALWRLGIFGAGSAAFSDFWSQAYGIDLGFVSVPQQATAATLAAAGWLLKTAVCLDVGALCARYGRGEIFAAESGAHLQRVGFLALAALLFNFFERAAMFRVLTAHLAERPATPVHLFVAQDFFYVLLALAVIAIGAIYAAGAAMAGRRVRLS
ncbi:MAG: hypothetical protein KGL46_10655 [Hyphomicrobiales bacterium]|nr:hypothetical protein [Hyphomicrobiales bacterium]